MRRYALALLPLIAGVVLIFSMGGPGYAATEEYPTGTQSVTIYPTMVGVVVTDSTQTLQTSIAINRDASGPIGIGLIRATDISSVPSGKAIIAAHLNMVASKVPATSGWIPGESAIAVGRVMSSWDSSAVTSTKRNATNQWNSNDIRTYAYEEADTTYSQTARNIRRGYGYIIPEESSAAGDTVTVDITTLFRAWYSGFYENNGIALTHDLPETTASSVSFYTSKQTNPPWITVRYTDAGGGGSIVQGPGTFGIR